MKTDQAYRLHTGIAMFKAVRALLEEGLQNEAIFGQTRGALKGMLSLCNEQQGRLTDALARGDKQEDKARFLVLHSSYKDMSGKEEVLNMAHALEMISETESVDNFAGTWIRFLDGRAVRVLETIPEIIEMLKVKL